MAFNWFFSQSTVMSTPQELYALRNNLATKIQGLTPGDPQIQVLYQQWANTNQKLLTSTLARLHSLLYNPNTRTVKSTNNLQRVINGLRNNNMNTGNVKPILSMYKDYLTKINSNKIILTRNLASKSNLLVTLKAEKNALEQTLAAQKAATNAALAGKNEEARALQAAANAKIAEMETAHAAALSNLKKIKQLEINKLTAEQLSLRIEQQTLKNKAIQAQALANQAARNLETARASGNAAAAKAAQLTANIAAKNAKAAEQNAEIGRAHV